MFKLGKYEAETTECEGKQQLSFYVKTFTWYHVILPKACLNSLDEPNLKYVVFYRQSS